MSREIEHLSSKLSQHGLRTTKARLLIMSFLSKQTNHPTADSILKSLRDRGTELGPATLYQNLSKLAEAGLLLKITGPDGLMHFDAKTKAHPHLICTNCGSVVDAQIDEKALKKLTPFCPHTGKSLADWQFDDARVELKGLCPTCQSF